MNIFSIKKKSGGFTIVEMIIYTALFAALSVMLINVLLVMLKSYTQMRASHDFLDSGSVVLERVTREIRGASSIDAVTSVFNSSPGVLKLNTTDAGGAAKTVQFSRSAGNVLQMLDSTDGTARDLTGPKISVTSLIFRSMTTTKGKAVRLEMTLQSTRAGATSRTITLYDTATLRSSYY